MSGAWGPLTEAALTLPCGYCGAIEGAWCVRFSRSAPPLVSGRASYLHEARMRPVRAGWLIGWRDAVDQVTHDLDTWADQSPDLGVRVDLRWAAERIRASWVARRT